MSLLEFHEDIRNLIISILPKDMKYPLALVCHIFYDTLMKNGHLVKPHKAFNNAININQTLIAYVKYGNLKLVQWAYYYGFRPKSEVHTVYAICVAAAENGDLKLLKWLHENGCPWDSSTCASAAKKGNLELLKWLRQNGCPWDSSTCLEKTWLCHVFSNMLEKVCKHTFSQHVGMLQPKVILKC